MKPQNALYDGETAPEGTRIAGGCYRQRLSVRGHPYWVWEPPLPRIKDEHLDCVLYLYRSRHEALEGVETGGSGFVLGIPAERFPAPKGFLYAITNRHVIEGGACTVRLNTADGNMDVLEYTKDDWVLSPTDDLAFCRLPSLGAMLINYKAVWLNSLLTKELVSYYNVGIGDDVFAVGRFINHEGIQRNMPTARFGLIAQMTGDPVRYSIGSKIHDQESFLVQTGSIGGYSGSPVFLHMDNAFARPETPGVVATHIHLLGVNWGHIRDWLPVCGFDKQPLGHGQQVGTNTGMAGVVPAWKLRDFLDSDEMKRERAANEAQALRARAVPAAVADTNRATERGKPDDQTEGG